MRVITCVNNKSLVQALESCPFSEVTPCTCCSANLSTFYQENSKSAGLVNAYMDSQVASMAELLSQNDLRSNLRACNF